MMGLTAGALDYSAHGLMTQRLVFSTDHDVETRVHDDDYKMKGPRLSSFFLTIVFSYTD